MTPSRIAELKKLNDPSGVDPAAKGYFQFAENAAAALHAVPELLAEVERLQEQRTHHSTLTLMEHERTKSQLASARGVIEGIARRSQLCLDTPIYRLPEDDCDRIRAWLKENGE